MARLETWPFFRGRNRSFFLASPRLSQRLLRSRIALPIAGLGEAQLRLPIVLLERRDAIDGLGLKLRLRHQVEEAVDHLFRRALEPLADPLGDNLGHLGDLGDSLVGRNTNDLVLFLKLPE